jgi:predicted metal-dependent hydrolase
VKHVNYGYGMPLEENEHKTVAYDVYEQVVGSYALRAGIWFQQQLSFFAVSVGLSWPFISCRWPIV